MQDRCAMKVGTDGVLLGAWVNIDPGVESILDIGTGSGLIALQMAQRSDAELIDALEIETNAFEQAVENFEKELIIDALKKNNGNQTKTAGYLDTSLRIINYKIHQYGIDPKKYKI